MEGLILFVVACLAIGILGRIAMGESPAAATKTTLGKFGGSLKTGARVGRLGWKIGRRW